jgi:hypothetical protein
MHYTVYKVTNTVNGKHYIGKHQTKNLDDGYMGSGKLIRAAIKKYGIENFTKEIIHVFDNEQEMNQKEKELVVLSEMSYNLCQGGQGGFGYINSNGLNHSGHTEEHWKKLGDQARHNLIKLNSNEYYQQKLRAIKLATEARILKYPNGTRLGKPHTDEAKRRIGKANSDSQSGTRNSQYGTMWITNGTENKKVKKTDPITDGWYAGRSISNGHATTVSARL